jgi:hypothetical protein
MPPTPQAAMFIFTEVWGPAQLENYIASFCPEGLLAEHLQTLLGFPQVGLQLYCSRMAEVALHLLMAGHNRSPVQVLQELGYIPVFAPLPPIQVLQ